MANSRPLAKTLAAIERYVVCTEEQRLALALWIVHTHCVEHFEQTPYLLVTSPQRRCGKTTLMELLARLVARPWPAVNPSEATVYRQIEQSMPTLLLDEVDAIFAPKTAQYHEGLRALLNAGSRQGTTVPRCVGVGRNIAVQDFRVYCAKALAGIGTLPDTIVDRSIPIRLQRKTRAERVERFRVREVRAATEPIREAIATWAAANGEALAEARPGLPDELNDRAQDACEPLIAIADALGYGGEARAALVELLTAERADSTESTQIRLLRDVREIFEVRGVPALFTEHLINSLIANGNGWAEYYGRGLQDRDLASLLRPYGIHSKTVREGEATGKGYHRDQFAEAWDRYLSDEEPSEAESELAHAEAP